MVSELRRFVDVLMQCIMEAVSRCDTLIQTLLVTSSNTIQQPFLQESPFAFSSLPFFFLSLSDKNIWGAAIMTFQKKSFSFFSADALKVLDVGQPNGVDGLWLLPASRWPRQHLQPG